MEQPAALRNAAKRPRKTRAGSTIPQPVIDARAGRYSTIPPHLRGLYRRAWGDKSRKSAIRAMCVECMGYARADVERCTSLACPLYGYRMTRSVGEPAEATVSGQ